MLKQRVITGLLLAPLAILAILYLPTVYVMFVAGAVLALAAWEWGRLAGLAQPLGEALYIVTLLIAAALLYRYAGALAVDRWLYPLALLWWLGVGLWLALYQVRGLHTRLPVGVRLLVGAVVLLPFWAALVDIHAAANGPLWLLYLVFVVWAADIGAYFTGKRFGRTHFATHVSPGKTLEGVLGGLLAVLILAAVVAGLSDLDRRASGALMGLSLATAAVSVIGDLHESFIKRLAGQKDSSQLLPGHGGILDRIDSLTAAAPVFWLGYLAWLKPVTR